MKTIQNLIKPDKKVYVKMNGADDCKRFFFLAEKEGFLFSDGVKPTEKHPSDLIAVLPDKTLCEWMDKWLAEYAEPALCQSTVTGYKRNIKNHIKPALGNKQLRFITQKDVQKFYNSLGRKEVNKVGNHKTLDTYTHVTTDMQKNASAVVGNFIDEIFGGEL